MAAADKRFLHLEYRPDVDGLRAVAVLSVVAFHAFPDWMPGGFIGVDVFFVISGFLISSLIYRNLDAGTFSFSGFYARRIRRIFPALLLVLTASHAFGWFVLLSHEYMQLGKHVAAGAGFVSNFVLWNESGYFDSEVRNKPLLHLWSLAIEEQFYLVWPIAAWLLWKKRTRLLVVVILVTLASIALNLKGIGRDSVATFYSPLTRLWELLCGSLLAWLVFRARDGAEDIAEACPGATGGVHPGPSRGSGGALAANASSVAGGLLLACGYVEITGEHSFPGAWALIPVLAAMLIISAGPEAWINRRILSCRVAVWFGLISFPLYLWHWPILTFARIVEGGLPERDVRLAAVALSCVLAWLTYRWVERPVRREGKARVKVAVLVLGMGLAAGAGYATFVQGGVSARQINRQVQSPIVSLAPDNPREHMECLGKYGLQSETIRYCRMSGPGMPRVALIGDSHAAALYHGLSLHLGRQFNEGLLLIGGRLFVDVAAYPRGSEYELEVSRGGARATRFVASEPGIETVVVVTRGPYYMAPRRHNTENWNFHLVDDPSVTDRGKVFEIGLRRTLDVLHGRKKKIIFVIETPTLNFDPSACQVRRPFGSGRRVGCAIAKEEYLEEHKAYRDLVFAVLADYPGVSVFDPAKHLCDEKSCHAKADGAILYGDRNHLSEAGSEFLARHLVRQVRE